MKIIVKHRIALQDVPNLLRGTLESRLTIENPKWVENERQGRWNGDTPRFLRLYQRTQTGLILPRGLLSQLKGMCNRSGINYTLEDRRLALPSIALGFTGTLRPFQQESVKAMLKCDFGTLSAPTGSGKTVMALALIAERKQPALIVVHTKELLNQWMDRTAQFLSIPKKEIGVIGGGKWKIGEKITIGMVQTLKNEADEVSPYIGHLIIDECHHCPSKTFTDVASTFDSKYMLGLSATPYRRDGLSKLIFWYVGDLVHEIKREDVVSTGSVLPFEVVTVETNFGTCFDPQLEYSNMLSELTKDDGRNSLIVKTAIANGHGKVSLLLTDRKAHAEDLQDLFRAHGVRADVLTGDFSAREREEIVARLNQGRITFLIATGQLVGEGFDCPALSNLFICSPIRFDGRLIQYLGRVLRPAPGKEKARVFDFVDSQIGVLRASAKARAQAFEAAGGQYAA